MLISWKCKPTFLRRKNFYNQLKSSFSAISERAFEGRFRVFYIEVAVSSVSKVWLNIFGLLSQQATSAREKYP